MEVQSAAPSPPTFDDELGAAMKLPAGRERRAALESVFARFPEDAAQFDLDFLSEDRLLEPLPATLGGYVVLRRLGHGAFGEVLLVRSPTDPAQRWAMKVLHERQTDPYARRTFDKEASALRQLDHDGIPKLVDTGVLPDGRPFLVLEWVPGLPIDAFCTRITLPLRDRLELMRHVCDAVQNAHGRGVLHRDLKPSNILASNQGKLTAKVIDFGLAKLVASTASGSSPFGSSQDTGGTAEYMAPEQAMPVLGQHVDVRADVYALGVVLYELIAGEKPFSRAQLTAHPELRRTSPLRPSDKIKTQAKGWRGAAARLGTDRRTVRRVLLEDLDWVVLKAMAPQPHERYASAAALAQDLDNVLAKRPVDARQSNAAYVLRRALRPYRALLWAGAAVLGAGVAHYRTTLWFVSQLRVANASAREKTATIAFQSAVNASQRGNWRAALAAYDEAEQSGYPDLVAIRLARVELRLGLDEPDAAATELAALGAPRDLGPRQGRALLLEAELVSNDRARVEEGLALAEQALATGQLIPADLCYAQAMRSMEPATVREQLEKALALDGSHLLAHRLLLPMLVLLGDLDAVRARAHEARLLFPEDNKPRLVEGLGRILAGESISREMSPIGSADAALLRDLESIVATLREGLDMQIEFLAMRLRNLDVPDPTPRILVKVGARLAAATLQLRSAVVDTSLPRLRLHPVLHRALPALPTPAAMFQALGTRESLGAHFVRELARLFPDPLLATFTSVRIPLHNADGSVSVENVEAADAMLVRGLQGAGPFGHHPAAHRLALLMRLLTLRELWQARHTGAKVERLEERIKAAAQCLFATDGVTFAELAGACGPVLSIADTEFVTQLGAEFGLRFPDHPFPWFMRGCLAVFDKRPDDARRYFERALQLDSTCQDAKDRLDKLGPRK